MGYFDGARPNARLQLHYTAGSRHARQQCDGGTAPAALQAGERCSGLPAASRLWPVRRTCSRNALELNVFSDALRRWFANAFLVRNSSQPGWLDAQLPDVVVVGQANVVDAAISINKYQARTRSRAPAA